MNKMSKLEFDTEKYFKDDLGRSVHVRYTDDIGRCGIVEIMGDGYVIAAYVIRNIDGELACELREVHDRLTQETIEADTMMAALRYGREIADLAIRVKGENV